MKEYLFVIWDISKDTPKFIKVLASELGEAKEKFAKAFLPFLDFTYEDLEYILDRSDVRVYCSEFKDITVV